MTTQAQVDTKTLAEFAAAAVEPDQPASGVRTYVVPHGWVVDVRDYERFDEYPRRASGVQTLHDSESFVRFVQEHAMVPLTAGGLLAHKGDEPGQQARATNPGAKLYGDADRFALAAVFNGDFTADGVTTPGWGDHGAHLALRVTEEWRRWREHDNVLMSQEDFALHIEDSFAEVREPDSAFMLELAQTFQTRTDVRFGQSTLLNSGQRQFQYEENTTATAGVRGDIVVPTEFTLGIAPFEGTQPYEITARLRYRVSEGKLKIGYKLVGPRNVERAAFGDVRAEIEELTTLKVFLAPVG